MAKRIAIIGARGFANQTDDYQIDCIPWDSLIKLPNLSDYDAIIINLIPLEEDHDRRNSVDWAAFTYRMHPRSTADVLLHDGQIIGRSTVFDPMEGPGRNQPPGAVSLLEWHDFQVERRIGKIERR